MAQGERERVFILNENDSASDDDEDADNEQPQRDVPPGRRERLERVALFDFLRLVAGNREPGFRTNEDLVAHLKRGATITSDPVHRAFLACPRDLFVPPAHRGEALADRPIRVEAAGFNISAPHVQAAALEALGMQPGARALDVGCGCGIVTAYMAYLAGSRGEVVGIDIRPAALELAAAGLSALRERNLEFSEVAAPITLERHNVFVPLTRHVGRYDAVHVGGAVPEDRVGDLVDLLAPGGGRIVAPVASELRLITKHPDGTVRHRVLSSVAFSELELPRDVEVVQAMEAERAERARRVEVPPSSFAADLARLAPPGVDLAALAAEAAEAGLTEAEAEAPPPAEPVSPRRSPNGVRPRSLTSLLDAHNAPATPAPAHRGTAREAAAGGGGGGDVESGGGGGGERPAAEGELEWEWEQLVPDNGAAAAAIGGGGSGGSGAAAAGAGRMDVEASDGGRGHGTGLGPGPREGGKLHATAAAAAAPAGPVDMDQEQEEGAAEGRRQRGQPPQSRGATAGTAAAAAAIASTPNADEANGGADGGADGGAGYLARLSAALRLGAPDCTLEGPGWRLPAHRAVLQARCDLLRARAGSGMRDSDATQFSVPDPVDSREAVEAFLHYVYTDRLPPGGVESSVMPQLIHNGIYFGCHRLVKLCEWVLSKELMGAAAAAERHPTTAQGQPRGPSHGGGGAAAAIPAAPSPATAAAAGLANTRLNSPSPSPSPSPPRRGRSSASGGGAGGAAAAAAAAPSAAAAAAELLASAVESAGPLLALADEYGLDGLRGVTIQFILDHFPAVAASEGYRSMPRHLADAVAAEAVQRYTGLMAALEGMAGRRGE